MLKRFAIAIVCLLLAVGGLIAIKGFQIRDLIAAGESFSQPPIMVTAADVTATQWETQLSAIGTFEAAQGVVITADLSGRVVKLNFAGGETVAAGDLLLEQDNSTESAELAAAEGDLTLAQRNLDRVTRLFNQRVVPRSELDMARSTVTATQARVDSIGSGLDKKQIVAPFSGRLGLKLVDIGQDLTKGVPIVSLQKVDPMLVNFSLPQQALASIEHGLTINATTDAVAGKTFSGKITAIDTQVDESTRTVRVQATLDAASEGEDFRLLPGMFAKVNILLPDARRVLMVPLSSVSFNTFGDSVFVLDVPPEAAEGEVRRGPPPTAGPGGLSALQQFVQLGERRGDFIEVTRGLEEGQLVAKDGVFKLRNGAAIDITEEGATKPSLNPKPANS